MSRGIFTIVMIGGTLVVLAWALKTAIDHSFYSTRVRDKGKGQGRVPPKPLEGVYSCLEVLSKNWLAQCRP